MKKLVFGSIFVVLFLSLLSLGAYTQAGSIGDIQLRFCEESKTNSGEIIYLKHLAVDLDQNEDRDICMQITNLSTDTMTIQLGFVDGTITNDSDHKKACKDEGQTTMFGRFMTFDKTPITLNAGASVEKHASLKFDDSMGGQILGCVTYYQAGALDAKGTDMLKILVRKANFIDVNLSGDINMGLIWLTGSKEIKNISNNDKIQIVKIDGAGNYQVSMRLKNVGSVNQKVVVEGVVSNLFSKNISSFSDELVIPAGETVVVSKVIEKLPWYSLFVSVGVDVSHKAIVNVTTADITEEMKATYSLLQAADFFMLTIWIILIGILLIALIIAIVIMIIHHKHHKRNNKKRNYHHHEHKKKISKKK